MPKQASIKLTSGFSIIELIIIVFAVGILALAGFAWMTRHSTKPKTTTVSPAPTQTAQKNYTVATKNDQAIFTDTKLSYSVTYPSDWTIKDQGDSFYLFEDPHSDYYFEAYPTYKHYAEEAVGKSLYDYARLYAAYETAPSRNLGSITNITTSSEDEGYFVVWEKAPLGAIHDSYSAFFATNDEDVLIELSSSNEKTPQDTFLKIAKSFTYK